MAAHYPRPYRNSMAWPTRGSAYYVAPNGSDAAAGSFAAPFLTIGAAQTAMQSGNKITYIRSGKTFLAAAITSGATSLTITAVGNMPASGTYNILIDEETLGVTAGAGTTTWTVTRAQRNTTAAAHAINAVVSYVYSIAARMAIQPADSNTTYSNYPDDLAVLDGNGNTTGLISVGQAGGSPLTTYMSGNVTNIWINGIRFQNLNNTTSGTGLDGALAPAVNVVGYAANTSSHVRITSCEFTRINPASVGTQGAAVYCNFYATDIEVSNCYFHDALGGPGFAQHNTDTGTTNSGPFHITDNYFTNIVTSVVDVGAIDFDDANMTNSFGLISRNKVLNVGASNNQYYLDDMSSNVVVFGDWASGVSLTNVLIHGGINHQMSNNVWDLTSQVAGAWLYQSENNVYLMAGNTFYSNIIYTSSVLQPKSGSLGFAVNYLGDIQNSPTATFTASFATTTMTVAGGVTGAPLVVGNVIHAALTYPPPSITAFGTGSGGNGTYTISATQTGTSLACSAYSPNPIAVASVSNLHYAPNVTVPVAGVMTNQIWNDPTQAVVSNWDGSDVTNANPLFRNPGAGDYTIMVGSPAFTLAIPFLPINPGGTFRLAGLPPAFVARPNNVIRTPDPNTGSALSTVGAFGTQPSGGTLPTNWAFTATAGLTTAIYYIGIARDGTPIIRICFYGTTNNTSIGVRFDNAAPVTIGVVHTGYFGFRICGGSMRNVGTIQAFIQDTTTNTNLGITTITPSGIETTIAVPCTAGSTVSTIRFFFTAAVTSGQPVFIMFELSAPQVVF